MLLRHLTLATFTIALLSSFACGSSGGGGGGGNNSCSAMCQHLLDDLGSCGKVTDQAGCVAECGDHIAGGDSTEAEVVCGANAADCTAWQNCGDLL